MKSRNPFVVLIWSFALFILIHTTQYVGCLFASVVTGATFESVISGAFSNHLTQLCQGLTASVLGIPFALFVVKFLWRRPFAWIRLQFDVKLLFYGLILGIGLPAVTLLVVGIFGDLHIAANPTRFTNNEIISILAGSLGWVMFIAITEELVFRGMAVREWANRWGWPVASLFGGIYFGIVHVIALSGISILTVLWILIAASVGNILFVALYVRGQSLWLPIGFHAGWNLCLKTFLGVTISGKESPFGLFVIETSGGDLVTGGVFGLEASVVVMVISIIVTVLLLRFSRSGKPRLMDSDFREIRFDSNR